MYGLANKVLQDMIVAKYGAEQWEKIREKSDVDEAFFVQMNNYPDALTYQIVGAASEVLETTPDKVLRQFGEYWIEIAERRYEEMVDFAGKDLVTILNGVNDIHVRAALIFEDMKPPSFECTDVTEDSFRLHYDSEREGLAPLVNGLLTGLSKRLNTPVDISHDKSRADGAPHDEFLIKYRK